MQKEKDIQDLQLKVRDLELQVANFQSVFKNQLHTLTIIFSLSAAVVVFITILTGFLGFMNIRELTGLMNEYDKKIEEKGEKVENKAYVISKDLESKLMYYDTKIDDKTNLALQTTETAIKDMEDKFDRLSGEGLKKADIKIYYNKKQLNGLDIECSKIINDYYVLDDIFFVNEGNRSAETFNVKLYCNCDFKTIITETEPMLNFESISMDTNYVKCYSSWPTQEYRIGGHTDFWNFKNIYIPKHLHSMHEKIKMKLIVYHSSGSNEAVFTVKLKAPKK